MSQIYSPYAVNADIVRKQRAYTKEDFFRARLLFRALFLIAFCAILSIFYIWSRVQTLEMGYEISDLRLRQNKLIEQNKKLEMEVAFLSAPQRIEKTSAKMGMKMPEPDQIRMIQLPMEPAPHGH